MPNLTIVIPTALVPVLTAAANELLDARKIDRSAMTVTQVGQRYIAEILKDVVISRQTATAQLAGQAAITAATAQATTDAAGITG